MGDPWIRVHANLRSKPVVFRAMDALGVSRPEAIGLLVTFWGEASQHAPNGRVGDYPDAQLEAWAGWERKRGKFAAFVRAQHLDTDGRVNEWDEYAGALETRRAADRQRKRKSRGSHADDDGNSEEFRTYETIRDEDEIETQLLPRNAGEAEAEAGLAAMLETDADRNALTAVIAKASNRLACIQALRSMLTGNDPALPQPTPSAFGQALRDMSVNNAQPTARKIRNYVLDAVRSQRELSRPPAEAMRSHSAGSHRPTSNGNGRGALMFGEIQKLIRELRQPGQAANRFIPRKEIEALGPDVVAAYDAIGGADRVLAATGKDVGFVLRDFVDALEAAHV